MNIYILNAISQNMANEKALLSVPISKEEAVETIKAGLSMREDSLITTVSAVGHSDTASVLSVELGFTVKFNRISVKLTSTDIGILCQYVGERLPEGAIELPKGSKFEYYKVQIVPNNIKDVYKKFEKATERFVANGFQSNELAKCSQECFPEVFEEAEL